MSSQVEVITPNPSMPSRTSLLEGVAVTSIAAIIIGFGFVALYIFNRGIVPSVLVLTSAAGMGLTAGFISRFELPKRTASVRWLVALFGLCIGMIPMGWLSNGVLGFDLITRGAIKPDWEGLLRLVLGAAAAWLAVRAWTSNRTSQLNPAPRSRSIGSRFSRSRRIRSSSALEPPSPPDRTSENRRPISTLSVRRPGSNRSPFTLGLPRLGRAQSKKSAFARYRRQGHINSSIRLMESIEHRCPFCLELIEQGDPRGSVECSICHTLHHADCWAVTGTCQVPHHTI